MRKSIIDFFEFRVFLNQIQGHHGAFVIWIGFGTDIHPIVLVLIGVHQFDEIDEDLLTVDFGLSPFDAAENRRIQIEGFGSVLLGCFSEKS